MRHKEESKQHTLVRRAGDEDGRWFRVGKGPVAQDAKVVFFCLFFFPCSPIVLTCGPTFPMSSAVSGRRDRDSVG